MSKGFRKLLLVSAAVLAAVIVLSGVGWAMFRGTPAYYRADDERPTDAQREQYAQAAENKMVEALNWAATLRADAERAQRASTTTNTTTTAPARAEASHVIEFTDDELNALFDKWSGLYGWRDQYADYLADPRIVLQDDRLILAGRMRELGGAVVSFQFRPHLNDSGGLRLDIVRVTGGRLPLPEGVWVKWRDQLVESAREHLPEWRAQARINGTGAANHAAMAATFSRMLFAVADNQPAEPVLFLPLAGKRDSVPVKVADVSLESGKLTLVVQPMTPSERVALLQRIRSPQGADSAQASGR